MDSSTTGSPSYVLSYVTHVFSLLFGWMASFLNRLRPAPTLKLKNKTLRVVKPLGEGGFSFVYLVQDAADNAMYALKRVRIQLPEHEERLKAEIAAHKAVTSPFIVKLVEDDVVRRGSSITEGLLLLPFYERGTVQDLIDRTPVADFIPLRRILQISIDICAGLMAFHSYDPPLAFRDLKPANVLIGTDGRAVLMDLGSVAPARVSITSRREALELQELCAETATAPFRAPELFDPPSNGYVDERTDVWALGCTIYAMGYRNSPFDGTTTAAMSGRVSFPARDPYGPGFRALISSTITTEHASRPSVAEIQEKCRIMLESGEDQV
ncbi:kinase-like domain-containing protein [Powellomyces hirtus]|nr:kinase-like domain-containing protein [Powellomyces hirtus]